MAEINRLEPTNITAQIAKLEAEIRNNRYFIPDERYTFLLTGLDSEFKVKAINELPLDFEIE
ncbi:MAG: hypothetical protein IPQ05_14605 [Leptospiraceae bacterium]|nr:hypothetical protein [Leptospiraceae bacterium]